MNPIKYARLMKGQTQAEVAKELKTSQKMIYMWEAGKTELTEKTKQKLNEWAGYDLFKEEQK